MCFAVRPTRPSDVPAVMGRLAVSSVATPPITSLQTTARSRSPRHAPRPRSRERGAALVETALIVPLLLALLVGVWEFGFLFRNDQAVTTLTRSGARVGSSDGKNDQADFDVLQAVAGAATGLKGGQLLYVVVYRATTANAAPSATCAAGSPDPWNGTASDPACNVYLPSDLATSTFTGFRALDKDRYWRPADRVTQQSAGTDWLGVYVAFRHDYLTKVFGGSHQLEDFTVMRLEPESQ